MIKEFGTVGFFIKFNESASTAFKLLEVFSSSAATTSLFSASTATTRTIRMPSPPSGSCYVNGFLSSSVADNQWQHVTITFNPKLQTDDLNNFTVKFGQSGSADFQIQNIYMLDALLTSTEVSYIHNSFVSSSAVISAGESASASVMVIDREESRHSSSVANKIYQPYPGQSRLSLNVVSVHDDSSLNGFVSAPMTNDSRYIDGVQMKDGDNILSITDNKVYRYNGSTNRLSEVSIPNNEYVVALKGISYSNTCWLKIAGVFVQRPLLEKIVYFLDES